MTELVLNCSIIIKKNEHNFYNIILNNLSNDDKKLVDSINNQLQLYNNILNDCFIKTKCFNDSEYEVIINNLNSDLNSKFNISFDSLKLDYESKINSYKNEILNKDLQINTLKTSYDSCYSDIKQNIEYQLTEQFKYKENLLNQQIINEQNKYLELNDKLDSLINIKAESIKNNYDIIVNNLKNEINQLQSKYSNLINSSNFSNTIDNKLFDLHNLMSSNFSNINKYFHNKDSTQSGELGETFIYDFLSDFLQLNTGSIQRVNGKNNAGDLLLIYNNLKCCIESKNHSSSIRQEQINRFINIDILHPYYNSGIFISFKSDFVLSSSIKHFDIKIIHNKPVIFISNLIKKPHEIILAIKIIDFILYQQSFDNSNIQSYISFLNSHIIILNQLLSINNSLSKNILDSNNKIKFSISEIEQLLNINSSKSKYICNFCNLGFDKKNIFNKHLKICNSSSDNYKIL
jgi:hypothetical protein